MTQIAVDVELYEHFTQPEREAWGDFFKTEQITPTWVKEVLIDTEARMIAITRYVVKHRVGHGDIVERDASGEMVTTKATFPLQPNTAIPPFLMRFPVGVRIVVLQSPPTYHSPAFKRPTEVIYVGSYTVTETDPNGTLAAVFKTKAGEVVPPDDIPVWTSSNPTVVSVSSQTPDGTACTLAYGVAGSAVVVCTSTDKDGTKLSSQDTFTVLAGEPTEIDTTFTPGTPTAPPADGTPPGTPPAMGTTVVLDPSSNLPLYTTDGSVAVDATEWTQVTDVTGPNAEPLYTFSGDTAGSTSPAGVAAGWALFTGTLTTVTPPS